MQLKEYSSYIIAFITSLVRYYDYALFGLSASMISKHFMPGKTDTDQLFLFYTIFTMSMFARPFGSIIFGKIGDKISRVASVKIAMLISAISTSLIAFIPDFNFAGWFSVALLTLCRMLFLISLAGEVDAIKIFVAEKVSKQKRHFAAGIISFSSQIGVLLASMMYHISISFEEIEWLWRVNFLLGGLSGLIIVLMREHLKESKSFLQSKSRLIDDSSATIIQAINDNKFKFLMSTIINGMIGGGYNFLIIFLGTFAANVADIITNEQATSNNIKIIALYAIASTLSGYIADKIKMITQITIAITLSIACVLIMEFMLGMNIFASQLHYLLAFIAPFYTIPTSIKMQSLFSTCTRMRLFSLSHSLGSLIFSSTTPFMCMLIWKWKEQFSLVLGYFLLQLIVLFFVLIFIEKKDYANMFEN